MKGVVGLEKSYNNIKLLLEEYDQNHLLMYYNKLNSQEQEELLNQISNIDFKLMQKLYEDIGKTAEENKNVEPIEYLDKYGIDKEEYEKYREIGENELKSGKLAVITMAGGQGTRLRT